MEPKTFSRDEGEAKFQIRGITKVRAFYRLVTIFSLSFPSFLLLGSMVFLIFFFKPIECRRIIDENLLPDFFVRRKLKQQIKQIPFVWSLPRSEIV